MSWQQHLKKLYLVNLQKKSPDFFLLSGGFQMKVKPYTDRNRSGLIRCITDLIIFSGGQAKATIKGKMVPRNDKMIWVSAPGKKATCDIMGVFRSKGIEVIVSKEQKFSYEKTAAGHRITVARFEDFFQWWKGSNVTIPTDDASETQCSPVFHELYAVTGSKNCSK